MSSSARARITSNKLVKVTSDPAIMANERPTRRKKAVSMMATTGSIHCTVVTLVSFQVLKQPEVGRMGR
ncbi:MAG: hypothetical protein QOH35_2736, partial [Acidobacteriaceae bacterium]|nr:hypothetical protein [Acidobacteriaceae bacterium]